MTKIKVAVIVGSLRKESFNNILAKALIKLGNDALEAKFLQIGDLPLYNQDLETDFPLQAVRFKKEIMAADTVLFVTPEYNRSIPGPLKNAIDWASRPYGKNAFAGKPAAICGTSQSAIGTACAQKVLRPVLAYLDAVVMGQPELYLQFKDGMIDVEGNITSEDTKKFLQGFMNKYIRWVVQNTGTAAPEEQLRRAGN